MKQYFTSDTHGNHLKMAQLRGFTTLEEHENLIIENWNKIVQKKDEVYHLGDFCFGSHDIVRSYRAKLNGKIFLILGNHDYANRLRNLPGLFTWVGDTKEIKINHHPTFLSHFGHRVWSKSNYNSWHLYGHSHGKLAPYGKSFDVGLETHDYKVWSVDEIVAKMDTLPDNAELYKGTHVA
jgi:calcineurin-like phosphoesterase family protein